MTEPLPATTPTAAPRPRRWRWLMALLIVPLVAYGLLAGIAIGHGIGALRGWQMPASPADAFAGRIAHLPRPERAKFAAAMRPYRPEILAARQQLIEARQHAREVLQREPYDPDAMTAALARVREATGLVQQRTQEATAKALAQLSPEARQLLGR